MNRKLSKNEVGLAHMGLIFLSVAVISVIAFAGFRVYQNNQDKTSGNSSKQTNTKKYDDQRVDDKVLSNLNGTEENEQ